MDRFLLLVVVSNQGGYLGLDEAWVCSQESQLAGIEDLLLLFNLNLELFETLSVEGNEPQVLSRKPFTLLAQVDELGMDWFLQVFDVDHDFLYPLIDVTFDLIKSFTDVSSDAFVVELVPSHLVVLELLDGLA